MGVDVGSLIHSGVSIAHVHCRRTSIRPVRPIISGKARVRSSPVPPAMPGAIVIPVVVIDVPIRGCPGTPPCRIIPPVVGTRPTDVNGAIHVAYNQPGRHRLTIVGAAIVIIVLCIVIIIVDRLSCIGRIGSGLLFPL